MTTYLISPAIDAFVASGTCMLLIGLLVASVRTRKSAARSQHVIHAFPPRTSLGAVTRKQIGNTTPQYANRVLMSTTQTRSNSASSSSEVKMTGNPKNTTDKLFSPQPSQPERLRDEAQIESTVSGSMNPAEAGEPILSSLLPPAYEALLAVPLIEEKATGGELPYSEVGEKSEHSFVSEECATGNVDATATDFGNAAALAPLLEPYLKEFQSAIMSNRETQAGIGVESAVELPVEIVPIDWPPAAAERKRPAPNLLAFYGLRQQPFDVTPDPSYLYLSKMHREAFTAISLGVENLRGFMALVSEPGMGKTTLLNKLMEDLRDSARVVFLFQTQCNSSELLRYLLTELEVEHDGMDIVAMHRALSQALFEEMLHGRRFVLIVDEAQNLQDSVLETIRLLSDYETTHSKLIQIVLAGQPQLVETLMRPGLVQLRQRIAVLTNLDSLSVTETAEYIEHRLRAAGWNGEPLFAPDAVALIAESSGGVPRRINNLCFNAMLAGYLQRQEIIDSEIVKKVVSELDLELLVRRSDQDAPDSESSLPGNRQDFTQLARALVTVLNGNDPLTFDVPPGNKSKTGVTMTGKLNEKVRSQSWSKKRESRIEVSFERDPASGVTVADRHYCCSFYVSEEQASNLQAGKPIRIKIEQD